MNKFFKYFLVLLIIPAVCFSQSDTKKITLEDIFVKRVFAISGFEQEKHLNDGEHYAKYDEDDNIVTAGYKDGETVNTILTAEYIKDNIEGTVSDYTFSKDEKKILISANQKPIYRRSYEADYYVYDIDSKSIKKVNDERKVEMALLSPDGNCVSYIFENNLFIKNLALNEITQITKDGKRNEIINGMPDWVYEEEFGMSRAYFWSDDSKKIAFIRFDESNVKQYTLQDYNKENYPDVITYKYPKAGEDNSKIGVFVFDIPSANIMQADLGSDSDIYIPRICWTKDTELLTITRMNRLQNKIDIMLWDLLANTNRIILTEESKTYIDENYDLTFLPDNSFLRLSQQDGYRHIYRYDINGSLLKQITSGKWEVNSIAGIDDKNQTLFYISDEPSVIDKAVYSINFDGSGKKLVSKEHGNTMADFSKGCRYYLSVYSDANSPYEFSIKSSSDGKTVRMLDDNKKVLDKMHEYGFVKKEFFKFKTSSGTELNGYIMKPEKIKDGEKLPVLMMVYGGPGSQQVLNAFSSFDYIWHQYICQHGYIIACVDNRGTGGRGEEFEKCTYLKLGEYELADQIEAAKFLGSLPYVDKNRIGMWGWSFGGYMSTLCITKGADYFSTAIAVAPVTDWRYYDNIYTERYMRKPSENEEGYKAYSPLYFTDLIKGKFLLVHGLEDDNVHPQNSFQLINELVKSNKQFEMQVYTNKNHNITGGNTRFHLFTKLSDFIFRNL
jgi:dipeptidyl-peptidase-4